MKNTKVAIMKILPQRLQHPCLQRWALPAYLSGSDYAVRSRIRLGSPGGG